MITLNLHHLFSTQEKYATNVPRVVANWVIEREVMHPNVEFQISCDPDCKPEDLMQYERVYGPSIPHLRYVNFPLASGMWRVKLIGDPLDTLKASGLLELLENEHSRIQTFAVDSCQTWRGYIKVDASSDDPNVLVEIRCDRNINEDFMFRGRVDELVKLALMGGKTH